MLTPIDISGSYEGTYIRFIIDLITDGSKKTRSWTISDKHCNELGYVKWFGPWRKYCFYPCGCTVFEQQCLREIAEFIESRSKERRIEAKKRREQTQSV